MPCHGRAYHFKLDAFPLQHVRGLRKSRQDASEQQHHQQQQQQQHPAEASAGTPKQRKSRKAHTSPSSTRTSSTSATPTLAPSEDSKLSAAKNSKGAGKGAARTRKSPTAVPELSTLTKSGRSRRGGMNQASVAEPSQSPAPPLTTSGQTAQQTQHAQEDGLGLLVPSQRSSTGENSRRRSVRKSYRYAFREVGMCTVGDCLHTRTRANTYTHKHIHTQTYTIMRTQHTASRRAAGQRLS